MSWRNGRMLAFDLGTTGIDTEQDRIVSACAALIPSGTGRRTPKIYSYLANPGIEIPAAASEVHGITTEHARKHGADPAEVTVRVVGLLRLAIAERFPIVGMNLAFDLTLLDRECQRHGIPPVAERPEDLRPVIDLFVIDKAADPYRKGSRKLTNQCENWGIELQGAHDSTVDALAAALVVYKMARGPIPRVPSERAYKTAQIDIGAMKLDDLHDAQVQWKAEQTKSFAAWLRKKATMERDPYESERLRKEADAMRPEWPFIPRDTPSPAEQKGLW